MFKLLAHLALKVEKKNIKELKICRRLAMRNIYNIVCKSFFLPFTFRLLREKRIENKTGFQC